MKVAIDEKEAWDIQHRFEGPCAWIQWKGTDVCMDVSCKCGINGHIDAMFAYFIKCPNCGTVYMMNGHIEMIEVLKEPDSSIITIE